MAGLTDSMVDRVVAALAEHTAQFGTTMPRHAKLHRLIREVSAAPPKFDRLAYQREYMRKKRAAKAKT